MGGNLGVARHREFWGPVHRRGKTQRLGEESTVREEDPGEGWIRRARLPTLSLVTPDLTADPDPNSDPDSNHC